MGSRQSDVRSQITDEQESSDSDYDDMPPLEDIPEKQDGLDQMVRNCIYYGYVSNAEKYRTQITEKIEKLNEVKDKDDILTESTLKHKEKVEDVKQNKDKSKEAMFETRNLIMESYHEDQLDRLSEEIEKEKKIRKEEQRSAREKKSGDVFLDSSIPSSKLQTSPESHAGSSIAPKNPANPYIDNSNVTDNDINPLGSAANMHSDLRFSY